jgi:hypothetical protein
MKIYWKKEISSKRKPNCCEGLQQDACIGYWVRDEWNIGGLK